MVRTQWHSLTNRSISRLLVHDHTWSVLTADVLNRAFKHLIMLVLLRGILKSRGAAGLPILWIPDFRCMTGVSSHPHSHVPSASFSLDFAVSHCFSSSPFCFSSYSVNIFSPSFWYSTLLLSQGCYGDVSFYTVGASSAVFSSLLPVLAVFYLLFWTGCKFCAKGCSHCFFFVVFPSRAGVRSCHVCLLTASSSHSTRGGWDLAEDGQVSFSSPLSRRGMMYFHPILPSFPSVI